MTPQQKIKHAILDQLSLFGGFLAPAFTPEAVDEAFSRQREENGDNLNDCINDVRCSGEATGILAPYSRHYEAKSVALRVADGSWVGWTYWYGGGKHAEPEAVDWIGAAYDLTCVEEEKLVVVRTFSKVADNPGG